MSESTVLPDGYVPREPERTVLYRAIAGAVETFLAIARARDRLVPRFVEREFRAYLECGILAHGFLRVHCDACGHDRLVPFSCKGRGFCPSCGDRRIATGPRAGQRVRRLGDRIDVDQLSDVRPPGCASAGGITVHAAVAVPARDRRRLERLCRYAARPALATDRLSLDPHDRLVYRLRHRWRDGTTHLLLDPLELMERLAVLVPPPRFHLVRYHGLCGAPHKPYYAERVIMRSRALITGEYVVGRPERAPHKIGPPGSPARGSAALW
jgi:hypothetical protein